MVYSLTYRRPRRVDSDGKRNSSSSEEGGKSSMLSGSSGVTAGIPDALAFDRIINGGTCPPCTVRDFMNYLLYVERAPENLQFYLWLRDYVRRFKEAKTSDIALAPEWTEAMQEEAIEEAISKTKIPKGPSASSTASAATAIFKGTDFEPAKKKTSSADSANPFTDPSSFNEKQGARKQSVNSPLKRDRLHSTFSSNNDASMFTAESYQSTASEAFSVVGLKQPFTIQPFREEINRVIATYLVKDSPRELNLSGRERYALFKALQYTTHPSAFKAVEATTESSLRRQAHPNFIRWTICNGNRPRVIFARGLGIFLILFGFCVAFLITLSSAGRGWRALAAILWVAGAATLIAAWKGMCVVLHGLHHRHLRPWELFEDPEVEMSESELDNFQGTTKSYEDEPWVIKYKQRSTIRKVFDREVWIQEPALRQIQDTIFLQGVLGGLLCAAILTAIFVVVPKGRFY